MQEQTTQLGKTELYFLSELRSNLTSLWEATLREEGIGWLGKDSRQKLYLDTSAEIDSLIEYEKLMCFYRGGNDNRKNRIRFLIDYVKSFYDGNSLRDQVLPTITFVPRVVRLIALLYKQGAERWIADDEKKSDLYADLMKTARIGMQSKAWHRIYKLCDLVAVQPVVAEKRGKKKLSYNIHSPNNFRILTDASGTLIKFVYVSNIWRGDVMMKDDILVVWTDTEHYYRDRDGKQHFFDDNPDGVNPYGEIPVVLMAKDEAEPLSGGMSSLVESNLHYCYMRMLETEDATFAAINTPVEINFQGNEDDAPVQGPRSPRRVNARDLDVPPKFEYVSGNPFMDKLREAAEKEEKSAAMREGVSAAMLSEDPQELSGKAIKGMMIELLEIREDDSIVMQEYETELYQKTRIVAEAEMGVKLPEDGFNIEFPDPSFIDDPTEELDFALRLKKEGFLSDLDIYRQFVSTRDTDEQALESMKNNVVQNRKKTGVAGLIMGTGGTEEETQAANDLLRGQS